MIDALIMVNFEISQEIEILEDSDLKLTGILTQENGILEENKQNLAVMNHNCFLGIVAGKGKHCSKY